MKDTTLVIVAWHRPQYLRQCLASWADARGSGDLRGITVRLGRSNPGMQTEMHEVAMEAAADYRLPVRVELDDPEDALIKGPDRALGKAINGSFNDPQCGYVIECDEDIIVSDDALEYFAWARSLNPAAVCAHNNLGQGWSPVWDDTQAEQDAVRLLPEYTSWCSGFTREEWQDIWLPQWDWNRDSGPQWDQHGWEWQMHRQANAGVLVAIPDASRCLNIGEHDGLFSLPGQFEASQAKSFRLHREPVEYRVGA